MKLINKKIRISFLGIALVLLLSSAAAVKYFDVSKNLEIFTTLYKELNLYYVDDTNPGELMKTGIDAMMKSLDPYTVYYPESKIEDARFMNTGQFGGVGFEVEKIDKKIIITEILSGFPADEAGLKAGDEIFSLDGQKVSDLREDQLDVFLKGSVGSKLAIEYYRKKELKSADLERKEIKIKEVPYFGMVNNSTGYIKLTSFTRTSSMNVRTALKELKTKHNAKELILDLRDNGGGLLIEAVNIVNLFVPKGQLVVSTKGKIESWNKVYETRAEPLAPDMPLIVLVNGKSASASEIVSGALQDLDRAVVLGTQSFGKGLVQQTKDLVYNSKMKLTIAKYYIPSGRCIQRLDYSNKVDGKAEAVADSLIKPFFTTNGRKVYDGRGVDPDVELEPVKESELLKSLKTNYVLFDYVNDYASRTAKPDTVIDFTYTDFNAFKNYALSQEFSYNTTTNQQLQKLLEISKEEQYFGLASNEFSALKSKLEPNKERDLERFKDELTDALEGEIVKRQFSQTGEIIYNLIEDPYITTSVNTFNSNYSSLLE